MSDVRDECDFFTEKCARRTIFCAHFFSYLKSAIADFAAAAIPTCWGVAESEDQRVKYFEKFREVETQQ